VLAERTAQGLALVLLLTGLLLGCGREVRTIFECPSADGSLIASFFSVSGGGAAGWSTTRIGLRRKGEQFNPDQFVLEMTQGYDAHLTWSEPNTLSIGYPDSATIRHRSDSTDAGPLVELKLTPHPSSQGLFLDESLGQCDGAENAGGASPST
jgi:hypothetical protein